MCNSLFLKKRQIFFLKAGVNIKVKDPSQQFQNFQETSDKKCFTWSAQDILKNYDLDHLEKVLISLNLQEKERFIEEINYKVPFFLIYF